MHDLHHEHPHPPRSRLISVSFDECCRDEIGLRLELGGGLLELEEDNMGVAEWRRVSGALGEGFDEQGEEAVL